MAYWLYDQVLQIDNEHVPLFTLQSALNFVKALNFELKSEYGATPVEQFDACRVIVAESFTPSDTTLPLPEIFEPLFYSLTYATGLSVLAKTVRNNPVTYPAAIVSWYYSYYNAFRAILGANNQHVADTHAAVSRAVNNGIRERLPHPFNIVATRSEGENYTPLLPAYPKAWDVDLHKGFNNTREAARGMLLQYMRGTADRETKKTKEEILKRTEFTSFRTKAAKEERDRRLQNEINFMHCVLRYRGKAHSRDAIFLTYGPKEVFDTTFARDLTESAQFSFILALAITERVLGRQAVRVFIEDVKKNLRGFDQYTAEEKFWVDFDI